MNKLIAISIVLIGVAALAFAGLDRTRADNAEVDVTNADGTLPGMELIWADEFDYKGLPDSTKWSYDVGDGCPNLCGWGNNQLEHYTERRAENARVEDGKLIIEAIKEKYGNREFTSARLVSREKGDWQYGRIEARMKLPSGKGTWPAFWMLSTDWAYGGWPESGEIDLMEHVGYSPDSIFGTVHTRKYNHMIGTHKGGGIKLPEAESDFHTFGAEWYPDHIDFFADGQHYFTFENDGDGFKAWPFDQRFHVILNLAVGGNWGGKHGVDETIWPQRFEIDYVRVYKLNKPEE